MQPGSLANFLALCAFLFTGFAALALWNWKPAASTRGRRGGSDDNRLEHL